MEYRVVKEFVNEDRIYKVGVHFTTNNTFYRDWLLGSRYIEPIEEPKKFGEIKEVEGYRGFYAFDYDGSILKASGLETYDFGNYFHTKEEAQERADWIKAALKIWRWVEDANKSVKDLNYEPVWYWVEYLVSERSFRTITLYDYQNYMFKLDEKQLAQQLIAELEPELKIFFRIK